MCSQASLLPRPWTTRVADDVARFGQALASSIRADGRAWTVWAAFTVFVLLVKLDATPSLANVFDVYREAAARWRGGQNLYPAHFRFNYFPTSAVFFLPWTSLSFALGGAIWRALNVLVFALGVWRVCALWQKSTARFLATTIVAILLSDSAARYGQMTLAMAGLMMLAVAEVERGAAWRAAIFCALAVAMKPLAIVLLLTMAVIDWRISWRIAVACAGVFLIPFLAQHPDYVLRQYAAVPGMLAARADQPYVWQHLFALLGSLGWATTDIEQTLVRGVVALFVLILCRRVLQRRPEIGVALYLYALTACYILLFGSATERNTYAMMGPIIGLLATHAWCAKDRLLFGAMSTLTLVALLSHTFARAYPNTALAMLKPAVCLVLFAIVSWLSLHSSARRAETPRVLAV